MSAADHPLFRQFPLAGPVELSTGPAPTPYHVYDGYGVFIGGRAELGAVRSLLAAESVVPLVTESGAALMGLWVCDFTDASLGPHHELQVSIFVTRQPAPPVADHPLALLAALLTRPDVEMLCHGLWNDVPRVVAYNRERLHLDARRSDSQITRSAAGLSFEVGDAATGKSVLSGALPEARRSSPPAMLAFMLRLGPARLWSVARQPWVSLRVVNPVGLGLDRNAAAETFTHNTRNVVRYVEPTIDSLTFGGSPYRDLAFEPRLVQYMEGFKFVYLDPG
jgi:hypothetical protein